MVETMPVDCVSVEILGLCNRAHLGFVNASHDSAILEPEALEVVVKIPARVVA